MVGSSQRFDAVQMVFGWFNNRGWVQNLRQRAHWQQLQQQRQQHRRQQRQQQRQQQQFFRFLWFTPYGGVVR